MKDWKHYLALVTVLLVGLSLFLFFSYNRQIQVLIVSGMAGAYVFWGVFHHTIKKDFHWRVLLEYLTVAILVTTVVIFLLLRA